MYVCINCMYFRLIFWNVRLNKLVQYAHYRCLKFGLQIYSYWNTIKIVGIKKLCPPFAQWVKITKSIYLGYYCTICQEIRCLNVNLAILMQLRHDQEWSCTKQNSLHLTLPFVIILSLCDRHLSPSIAELSIFSKEVKGAFLILHELVSQLSLLLAFLPV